MHILWRQNHRLPPDDMVEVGSIVAIRCERERVALVQVTGRVLDCGSIVEGRCRTPENPYLPGCRGWSGDDLDRVCRSLSPSLRSIWWDDILGGGSRGVCLCPWSESSADTCIRWGRKTAFGTEVWNSDHPNYSVLFTLLGQNKGCSWAIYNTATGASVYRFLKAFSDGSWKTDGHIVFRDWNISIPGQ